MRWVIVFYQPFTIFLIEVVPNIFQGRKRSCFHNVSMGEFNFSANHVFTFFAV